MQYTWGQSHGFDLTAIPKAAAQQLRMASGPQVKVLVWLACAGQGSFDAVACGTACGLAPSVCEEALRYWVQCGLVRAEGTAPAVSVPAPVVIPEAVVMPESVVEVTPPPTVSGASSVASYPDRAQVIAHRAQDPAFAVLLDTAATKLGKILSPSDMSVFLYLYRELSMPPEVILMVIGYAVQHGKGKMAYIEKTAIAWSEDGINTFEAADAHLRDLEQCAEAWETVRGWQTLDIANPTMAQKKILRKWIFEWAMPREVIEAAVAHTVEKTGKCQLSYADRVAERLHALDITTADAAKAELTSEKKPAKKTSSRARMKTAKDRAPSYDLSEYEKLVRRHRPTPPKED